MKHLLFPLSCAVLSATTINAQNLTVAIESFGDPSSFVVEGINSLNMRVSELVPAPGASNTSTHVLVEGLSPLEDGTLVYASPYQGIDSSNGEVQDIGMVMLEMPEAVSLPEGTVSSPIVGVLQRAGSWSDYAVTLPTTSLGGASGSSGYSGGTLQLTLARDAEVFTGSTSYTVLDQDTIELEPFTMVKDGGMSVDLSGTTLLRNGGQFYGSVTNLSAEAAYDSLLFAIRLLDIPDLDEDGIPDISDPSIEGGVLLVDDWTKLDFSWVYGYTPDWGVSTYMGFVYVAALPWVFQVDLDWLYYHSSVGANHYFWSPTLGWLLINEGFGGFYYRYDTNDYTQRIPQPGQGGQS